MKKKSGCFIGILVVAGIIAGGIFLFRFVMDKSRDMGEQVGQMIGDQVMDQLTGDDDQAATEAEPESEEIIVAREAALEAYKQLPDIKVEEDAYEVVVSEDETTESELQVAFEDGILDEAGYHSARVSMALRENAESTRIVEGQTISISNDLQWMINHESTLSAEEKALLDSLIPPSEPATGFHFPWTLQVRASEGETVIKDLEPPQGFNGKVSYRYDTEDLGGGEEYVSFMMNVTELAGRKFGPIFGNMEEDVEISFSVGLTAAAESTSAYRDGTYYICLSSNAEDSVKLGALCRELFNVYNYGYFSEVLNEPQIIWLREATSLWAVNEMFLSINYDTKYISHLYNEVSDTCYMGNINVSRSWYQYFQYTEELGGWDGYVKAIMKTAANNLNTTDLNRLLQAGRDEKVYREAFGQFAMFIIAPDSHTGHLKTIDPSWIQVPEVGEIIHETFPYENIENNTIESWMYRTLKHGSFQVVTVAVPADKKNKLDIINDLNVMNSKRSGMAIAKKLAGGHGTSWVMMPQNETSHYTFDLEKEVGISRVKLLFYNSDMEDPHNYAYQVMPGKDKTGAGNLVMNYTEVTDESVDGGYRETITVRWKADEQLKQVGVGTSGPVAGAVSAMVGNTYTVSEMSMDYDFEYTKKRLEPFYEETITASGIYFYNSAEDADAGNMMDSLMPEGMDGMMDELNEALQGLEGLGGMDGIEMPDMSVIEEGQDLLNGTAEGLNPEEMAGVKDLMKAMNAVNRVKYSAQSSELNLYPTMPPGVFGGDWITGERTVVTEDVDGKLVTEKEPVIIQAGQYVDLMPKWFMNPSAQGTGIPEVGIKNQAEMEQYFESAGMSIADIQQKVAGLTASGNAVNVYNMNGAGPKEFDLGGLGRGGTAVQTVQYGLGGLSATYGWREYADNTKYSCDLSMNYSFSD